MSVSEKLKTAVTNKDFVAIRDSLWSRIALDPNFTKGFPESWNYCIQNGISESDIYEEHDGRPLSDEVTNDNFSALCGELSTNFSRERLEKIREIGQKLYPSESTSKSQTAGTGSNRPKKTNASSSKSQDDGSAGLLIAVGAGILIGAVGGGILGGLLFKKAVIGAIAGAAVGGLGATLSKR